MQDEQRRARCHNQGECADPLVVQGGDSRVQTQVRVTRPRVRGMYVVCINGMPGSQVPRLGNPFPADVRNSGQPRKLVKDTWWPARGV